MSSNILTLCDVEDYDFEVVAIHSVLEDYKLAYLLNDVLGFSFKRISPDLDYIIKNKKAFFSAFEYRDSKSLIDWYLIENKFKIKSEEVNSLGLFHTEASFASTYVYLQPEVKEADFIIKVQGDFSDQSLRNLLKEIKKVDGIVTAYAVESQKLNHKEYLTF